MCSGRMNPGFVINALQQGADGVLISGCHPGECHYMEGNYIARRRFILMRKLMEYIGIEPERFRVSWVSASEGDKFKNVIAEVTEDIRKIGPIKQFRREV